VLGGPEQELLNIYHEEDIQKIVQSAAVLVDGGRAGHLSRLQETLEFAQLMGYEKIGVAYCYGMETLVIDLVKWFRKKEMKVSAISCTAGSMSQKDVNLLSSLPGVSCNPITQAEILNKENIPFAVTFGLCMGHDILFNRQFKGDVTTLLVKDRTCSHNPLKAIQETVSELTIPT